jgi:hypothetical protein
MRLYYMTAAKWAPVILREKRLKISTIPELNDPFELLGASIGEKGMRQALEILHAHWARELGMICMTDNWHSPVMWAHYADKHYGICLGFDVSDRPGLISEVDYVPDRLQDRLTLDKSRWGVADSADDERLRRRIVNGTAAVDAGVLIFTSGVHDASSSRAISP